jgi:hypothetical protein
MKRLLLLTTAALLLVAGNALHAQEKKGKPVQKNKMATMPDSAAMMKAWESYMTPGKFHQMMAKDDGTWNEEITMWMDPSAPPTKSTATAENRMIMGGRYQESVHKGDFNGMPFEGRSILGYDNAKKVYVSNWIDNMGTGMMYMEGQWDQKLNGIVFRGKSVDPMTGKELPVREVFRIIDDNTQIMEMYDSRMGKEMKTMEIRFTRK